MKLFAETCEKLSQESSTLNKIEIICNSIKEIKSDDELYLFSLYLTGVVYPSSVQKTINVGGAWVREATIKLLEIDKEAWDKAYKEFGESGETVQYLLSTHETRNTNAEAGDLFTEIKNTQNNSNDEHGIALQDFKNYIELLNQNSKSLVKVSIIQELLSKLDPLEAKYAMKILLGRMRIGVQEPTVEESIAKAFEIDKKQVKLLNFYIGDIGEVAVRSKHKNFENVEFQLLHPIRTMLASAEVEISEIFGRMGESVWAEYKYDGMRSHIHKKGDQIEIFTRDLKNVTKQFPEVAEIFKDVAHNFLIDGEIVPYKNGKIGMFAELQRRLGKKENIEEIAQNNPMSFIAYDILYLDGEIVLEKTLSERRELLESTFGKKLMYSTKAVVKNEKEFMDFFMQSKSEGREGLLIKNPNSQYEPGKRGIHWLKYKQTLDPLDVVVMIAEYGEGKNAKYLSNYTFGVWDEKKENIIPVGRVYSGAKEEDLKYFTEYLPTIATEELPRGFKLEPRVIFEVGFENVQKSERYISGFAVRFPRILRIRKDGRFDDKGLDEINTIKDVENAWKKLNGVEEN